MHKKRLPDVPRQARIKRPKALSEEERRRRLKEANRRYRRTPKGLYTSQKRNAKQRGIPFLLSFVQWLKVWKDSGRFDERGNKTSDGYVMGRYEDRGPYAIGNVKIIRHGDNIAERNISYARRRHYFSKEDMTESWLHVHSAADAD